MIDFDEKSHTYSIEGRKIPSVSEILNTVLGENYGNVPEKILKQASEKGTLVHFEIELFENDGVTGFTDEFLQFLNFKKTTGTKIDDMEQVIYNKEFVEYAGRYDISTDDSLIDIKTTYKLDIDRVTWQQNLYNNALKKPKGKLFVLWLRPEKWEFIELQVKTKEEINSFLQNYINGDKITKEIIKLDCLNPVTLPDLKNCLKQIKEFEKKADEFKKAILAEMKERRIKKYDDDELTISLIDAGERESLDSEKIKEKYPEIYNECKKITKVKESIRIKISE
jgi:hypothetical protein